MRWLVVGLGLWGAIGCNNVDHPPVLDPCDPERMKCGGSASGGGGEIGGSSTGGGTDGDSWVGDIIEFSDDTFYRGSLHNGLAVVTAHGNLTFYTSADYDGDLFILQDVKAENPNWFSVDPDEVGLMTTIQPIDTDRSPVDLTLGVANVVDVDHIFGIFDYERSPYYSQLVLRAVNANGNPLAGVQVLNEPGLVAYRDGNTWTNVEGASTDDSGLIFLGNVSGLNTVASLYTIVLIGTIEEDVEVLVQDGLLTVADVPFY